MAYQHWPSAAIVFSTATNFPDRKVHGANMGPTWGPQDPGGPNVGPINLAIWGYTVETQRNSQSNSDGAYPYKLQHSTNVSSCPL